MQRLSKHIVLVIGLIMLPQLTLGQHVSNVTSQQKGNTIEVSYTLDKEADTRLYVVIDGQKYLCRSVHGDIGINVSSGRKTATWNVLDDMEKLVGNVYFTVQASQSTRSAANQAAAYQRKKYRESRMQDIHPLAGIDINAGFYGVGASIYWPWVTSRPSRVGSYASYVWGMKDWKDSDVDAYHNICLGVTVTLSQHVALFAAPGLSIVQKDVETYSSSRYSNYSDFDFDDYYSNYFSNSSTYKHSTCTWAAEAGISFKFLIFSVSLKYAYPSYIGIGAGFDFSNL